MCFAAALKELMINIGPPDRHPVRPGAAALQERMINVGQELMTAMDHLREQDHRARPRSVRPAGDEMVGNPGSSGRQLQGMDDPDWTGAWHMAPCFTWVNATDAWVF